MLSSELLHSSDSGTVGNGIRWHMGYQRRLDLEIWFKERIVLRKVFNLSEQNVNFEIVNNKS